MAKKPYNGASSSLADFKQVSLLGEGAYSAVYKVVRLADRETYALKKVKLPSLSDKEKQNALNEVRLLASVRHENILAYKEAFFDDKTRCLCIVTEFADAGDLFQQITKCQKSRSHLPEADVWRYIFGMCHGLKALHDLRILHRDLKCANVFLRSTPHGEVEALLGDFNVSKVAKRGLCMTQTGTPYYASPEVWRDMPYDAKSDMWSLGCVLYEMMALKPPFRAEDMEGLYRKVLRGQYPRLPPHYSHDLSEVIGVLLQVNPRHRPSVDQLLQMPVMRRHAPDTESCAEPRAGMDLLSTIKLPKNALDLATCLPKPQYDIGFSPHDESGGPPSQESAVRMNSGTPHHRPTPGLPGRGTTLSPTEEIPRGGRETSLDNYQDSLDQYVPMPPTQENAAYNHTSAEAPRHMPTGTDSLDVYMQTPYQQSKNRLPPPGQRSVADLQDQDPIAAAAQLRDSANPRAIRRQEQQADYGAGRGAPQYNAYPPSMPPPPPRERYGVESGYEQREDPRVRASPAPSSYASASRGQQPAYAGGQQYRARERERKPMASYARQQYSVPTGSQVAQQQPPPRQASGGLRLPRIFTKASS
jgi:serine/threonine protein kinase